MIDMDLITDFFLFLFIGTGMAFFQIFIMKRDFPGRMITPLAISLVGSFGGSLLGSYFLSSTPLSSLWILAGSACFFSFVFLQVFYSLSRVKDYY
ncbi:MAG: hypothetical protein JXA95_00200 [Spirochaetales bacterium]|nr:hypothetical protein [Spirochaetales bacterium]